MSMSIYQITCRTSRKVNPPSIRNSNTKWRDFSSQKATDFPLEAVNMLEFLTMFIHYADLPIKVSLLSHWTIENVFV